MDKTISYRYNWEIPKQTGLQWRTGELTTDTIIWVITGVFLVKSSYWMSPKYSTRDCRTEVWEIFVLVF